MTKTIDCFAPHLYPFLFDKADIIAKDQLGDWSIRNAYRSLGYLSNQLDAQGFKASKFYISEWGVQADSLIARNELLTSMATAISTAKEMMTIYSFPRVVGATWHQFMHATFVSKTKDIPISQWGEQTLYVTDGGRCITTPPAEAVRMFVSFGTAATLVPYTCAVPKGIHYLCANDAKGKRYFVVNSTGSAVRFPAKGVIKRTSLFANSPTATSILKYGTYGDAPGDVKPILPKEFKDTVLPPYSVNILR